MKNAKNVFTIVYACDNNFISLLAASIKSLQINSPGSIKEIYVISDGITESNWKKLSQSVCSEHVILKRIPHKEILSKSKIPYFNNSHLPLTVFFRIFIESFLPADIEKLLYLDADTIVLEDLAKLWETDLGDHVLAAVQDLSIKTFDCSWGGVRNFEALSYPGTTKYFNSGLMLINFKRWKEFGVLDKILNVAREHKKYILYGDQYCLNVVLANKWLPLNPNWNHPVDYYLIDSSYQPDPFMLHFTGTKPIYVNYNYSGKYRDVFFRYLNQTEWKDIRLKGIFKQKLSAVKRVLRKLSN